MFIFSCYQEGYIFGFGFFVILITTLHFDHFAESDIFLKVDKQCHHLVAFSHITVCAVCDTVAHI